MTFAAALTQLETLTFTGLVSNLGAVDAPPHSSSLPVLITEDVSLPFVETLQAWNVEADKSTVSIFIDHILLVEGVKAGSYSSRWANTILYLDRYVAAITADLTLNDTLVQPLRIIVLRRGDVFFRNNAYSGIIFRHFWNLRVP